MQITRRDLIANFAAVAAVSATASFPAVAAISRREEELFARYEWAYEEYCFARKSGDYSAFVASSPSRMKLARLWRDLRGLDNPSFGEQLLREPMEILWFELTRPNWDNF